MSASVRPSVRMFREPGYPWIAVEVQALMDRAVRVLDEADDPVDMALDLSAVAELLAQQLRDFGADVIMERAS